MQVVERSFGILLALIIAAPALGGEKGEPLSRGELEKLLRRQGEEIRSLKDEVQDLRNRPDHGLAEDVERYLAATDEPAREAVQGSLDSPFVGGRLRLGGYFSLEFRDDGDAATMEFDQHRLVLKVQADIAEGIGFDTEIEIEGGGADVDFLSGNEILVEYAELSFQLIEDKLHFIAGAILIPWGRFNQYHDDPLNEFTDRPLVSRRIAAVAFGQAGIATEGTLEFGDGWFFDYDVALVQGFDGDFSTNGGVRDARQSYRADNNDNKQVFGRFVVSPPVNLLDVLEVGASFAYGKHDDAGDLMNYGYGVEVFCKKGRFRATGEYMMLRIEQPASASLDEPRRMDGWYVEFAYDVFPGSWRGKHVLFTDESTFTLVVRVEAIDLNHSRSGSTFRDDLQQVSIGFNFRPVRRTVFKISYTFVDSDEAGSGSADRVTISWASYF